MGNNLVYVDPANNNQIHCQDPNDEVILKAFVEPSPTPTVTPTPSTTPTVTPTITVSPTVTPTPTPSQVMKHFNYNSSGFGTENAACGTSTFVANAYLEIGYSVPTVGAYFYTTQGGSTGVGSTCPNYYAFTDGVDTWAVRMSNNSFDICSGPVGQIISVTDCSTLPSVTPTPTSSVPPTPTPSCARPGGLSTASFYHGYEVAGSGTGYTYFNDGSVADVCLAEDLYNNDFATYNWVGQNCNYTSLSVGGIVYSGIDTSCDRKGSGYYVVAIGLGAGTATELDSDGIILTYPDCTPPTPTPTPTVTPTVTPTGTPTPTPTISVTPTITPSISVTPTPSTSESADPFANLEACWDMEESSGTVYDSTANNNDLPVNGGLTYQYPGKIDSYSIHNSGTGQLSGGTANTLGTFPVSVSGWFVFSAKTQGQMQVIIDNTQYSPTPAGYDLHVSSPSVNVGYLGWNFPGQSMNVTNFNIKDGAWHHIVATATGLSGLNSVGYWIDGVDRTSGSGYMSTDQVDLPNHVYRVGNLLSSTAHGILGEMDSVKVFSRVLSSDDIAYLYNSGSGRSCP